MTGGEECPILLLDFHGVDLGPDPLRQAVDPCVEGQATNESDFTIR